MFNTFKDKAGKQVIGSFLRGKEIYYVSGMRRSGNHAFINWLKNALEKTSVEFEENTGSHFLNYTPTGKTIHLDEINMISGKKYARILWENREVIQNCKFVILSTEDCGPEYSSNFRIPWFNAAIYVKRNVLNVVASRLRYLQKEADKGIGFTRQNVDEAFFDTLMKWETNHPFKVWRYDEWIISENYRRNFLRSLGLDVDILPSISSQGNGSSFTGQRKRPDPEEALNRYQQLEFSKHIVNLLMNDKYQPLLTSKELNYLQNNYS